MLRQLGMVVGMRVMMLIRRGQFAVRRSTCEIMLVKTKPTQQQQHEDEIGQGSDHYHINRLANIECMRY